MEILENESMAAHTSLKTGGCARYFIKIHSIAELAEAENFAKAQNLPIFLLGKGTNLLVSDKGFAGVIVQLGPEFSEIQNLGDGRFQVGAATPLARLARYTIQEGFAGIHKLAGIPGSLGGAIYMNAGAYGQEIGNAIVEVKSLNAAGEIVIRNGADCGFSYRHSIFQDLARNEDRCSSCNKDRDRNRREIILEATLQLTPGDTAAMTQEMETAMEKRRRSQPLNFPNAGSTFKRLAAGAAETPTQIAPGYYIEQAGLKGFRIGGAEVSTIHANFIINTGNATAKDIADLCQLMAQKVQEKFGISLQREIIFLGDFD